MLKITGLFGGFPPITIKIKDKFLLRFLMELKKIKKNRI